MKPGRVDTHLRAIVNGGWNPRIGAIHFSKSGQLQNGQHRLAAISKSGSPVPVKVEFGMPDEAVEFYDLSASSRSASDHMARHGITVTGGATILSQFVFYVESNWARLASSDYGKVLQKYPDFKPNLELAAEIVKPLQGRLKAVNPIPRFITAAVILLYVGHSEDRVRDFMTGLAPAPGQAAAQFYTNESLSGLGYGYAATKQALHTLLWGFNKWARQDMPSMRFKADIQCPLSKLVKP